jgi:hypothetical protein
MPKIYKYLGIIIRVYPKDHYPIHVHAFHGTSEVVVCLYEKDGIVQTVRYQDRKGKFTPAQMNDLKTFVSKHKNALLLAYNQLKKGVDFKMIEITKRIK